MSDLDQQRYAAQEAGQHFDLLLEAVGEGVYGIDKAGICTFVNGAALAMLGFPREELVGTRPHALVHHTRPDGTTYPEAECPIGEAIRSGAVCRVDDEIFFRKDGSSFPVEYGVYPIASGNGSLGALITFTDLSYRKRSLETIRTYERRYRELFDHVSDGIYQTSPEGELLAANSALVKMLGYDSEQELRAVDVNSLYQHPEDRKRLTAKLESEGLLRNECFRLKMKSGQPISVVENARTVRDGRGRVLYYEGALRPDG